MSVPALNFLKKLRQHCQIRSSLYALEGLLLIAVVSPALHAQIDTGAISGMITDAQGAALPNTTVQIRNEATGYTDMQPSRQDGSYRFTAVKIGSYTITATANGFKKVVHEHVSVAIQQQVQVDFRLEVASVNSTVEIIAGQSVHANSNLR